MADFSARTSLAAKASIATTALAALAGGLMPAAHATNASPGGPGGLTISDNAATVAVAGGTAISVAGATKIEDASWSPDGSRFAFVNQNGDIVVAAANGSDPVVVTPPAAGTIRRSPVWAQNGSQIIWSEAAGSANAVLKWARANGTDLDQYKVPQIHDVPLPGINGRIANPDVLVRPQGDLLVFQVTGDTVIGGGKATVVALDESQATSGYYPVALGSTPKISSDGKTIAYVGVVGGNLDQIMTASSANPGATLAAGTAVTKNTAANTHPYAHPVWSPDGTTIYAESLDTAGGDVDTLKVNVATGAQSLLNAATKTPGLPAFQTEVSKVVRRLAGNDRLGTAIAVSKSYWGAAGAAKTPQAKSVVLSRSDQFADALGGAALAAKESGPLLLTPTAALDANTRAEILRVLGGSSLSKTVYILGGVNAVSPGVETALKSMGYTVTRVGGADRFGTAVQIANTITGGAAPNYILVATGMLFPDALSAGAVAGAIDAAPGGKTAVVLLTNNAAMPTATADYIAPLDARTIDPNQANFVELDSVGKQASDALSSHWIPAPYVSGSYSDFSGTDRYQTSLLVAQHFFGPRGNVGLATALNWADALSGGALMGTVDGPVLLVNPATGPSPAASQWLRRSSGGIGTAYVFGGTAAVSPGVVPQVGVLITGPTGFTAP